jgi:hypothetical protein
MSVEGIDPAKSAGSAARTEFQRHQEKLASDLAEKAAQKVAAADKKAIIKSDEDALKVRQESGGALDLLV